MGNLVPELVEMLQFKNYTERKTPAFSNCLVFDVRILDYELLISVY